MFCPTCGQQNSDEFVFCVACGRELPAIGGDRTQTPSGSGATDVQTERTSVAAGADLADGAGDGPTSLPQGDVLAGVVDRAGTRVRVPTWGDRFLRLGWREAAGGAAAAAGAVYALSLALVVMVWLAIQDGASVPEQSVSLTRLAGLLGLVLLGVTVRFSGSTSFPEAIVGELSLSAPLLVVFALAALVLVWAGRRTASVCEAAGAMEAAGQGAKVAIPYAVVLLLATWAFRMDIDNATLSGSAASAIGLGLTMGALFGAWGGLRSQGDMQALIRNVPARWRGWAAATVGAVRGFGVGLGTASAVVVAVSLYVAAELDLLRMLAEAGPGAMFGAGLVFLLTLPTNALNVLLLGHGATLEVPALNLEQIAQPDLAINYLSWGVADPGPAPVWVLLLVVLPVVSVVVAGRRAADLAPAQDRSEAQTVGSRVAVPYAVMAWGLATLAVFEADGFLTAAGDPILGTTRAGPALLSAFVVPLIWGALGGALAARLRHPSTVPVVRRPVVSDKVSVRSGQVEDTVTPRAPHAGQCCTQCGTPIRDGATFCTSCGAAAQPQAETSQSDSTFRASNGSANAGPEEAPEEELPPSPPGAFCTGCGSSVRPDSSFCTSCGRQRDRAADPP